MWPVIVATVSVAVTAAVVAWFVLTHKHPENAATHRDENPDSLAERFYGPHPSAPAGPDAESQQPEDTGNAWDPPPPPARPDDASASPPAPIGSPGTPSP